MINFYRFVRGLNEVMLVFNGLPEDVASLQQIMNKYPKIEIKRSKREQEVESGYYCYFRGPLGQEAMRDAFAFIRNRFTPPFIDLLFFMGNKSLSGDKKKNRIQITKTIENHLRQKMWHIFSLDGSVRVFPPKPYQLAPSYLAYIGFEYKTVFWENNIPALQVDIAFRHEIDGVQVKNDSVVKSRYGDKADEIFLHRANCFNLSTEEIFNNACGFVSLLPTFEELGGLCFICQPCSANELGMDTWLWSNEAPVRLRMNKNKILTYPLAKDLKELGYYSPPQNLGHVFIVMPSPHILIKKNVSIDIDYCLQVVENNIRSFAPESKINVDLLRYDLSDEGASVTETIKSAIGGDKTQPALFLIISPPREDRVSSNPDDIKLDQLTNHLAKNLRYLIQGSFTETVDLYKLVDRYDMKYSLESILMRSFVAFGGIPWLIDKVPLNPGENVEDICFIGLDINQRNGPVVGGVLLDGFGRLGAFHMKRCAVNNGDHVALTDCMDIISKLLKKYETITRQKPRHIVVHLDGTSNWERPSGEDLNLGIDIDIVEIRKSGGLRMRMKSNRQGTPSRELGISHPKLQCAYLINIRSERKNEVFSSPDSLVVNRFSGKTDIKILAAQVYTLSNANYNGIRSTEQIPCTINYADALVNNKKGLKKSQEEWGGIPSDGVIYWL